MSRPKLVDQVSTWERYPLIMYYDPTKESVRLCLANATASVIASSSFHIHTALCTLPLVAFAQLTLIDNVHSNSIYYILCYQMYTPQSTSEA